VDVCAFSPVPPEGHRDDVRQGAGRQFAWLEADSCKVALSRPTHAVATGTPAKYAGAGREPLGAKRKEELGDGMRT
jgi:hypothetical protein